MNNEIDFKKLFKEDEDFRQFMLAINEALMLNDPNFTPLIKFMYALYQSGISTEIAVNTLTNFQRMKRIDS